MNRFIILNGKRLKLYAILAAIVILAGSYIGWKNIKPASTPPEDSETTAQIKQLAVGKFSAKTDSGQTIDKFLFYPSTIIVKQGMPVELRFSSINGEESRPFAIEGLALENGQDISGTIDKGKTTIVRFTPKEKGIFPVKCQEETEELNSPMIGYLIVE